MTLDLRAVLSDTLGGSFRVDRELTGGGMSRVYTAQDLSLDRTIVIKVLPPELCGLMNVERFKREIRVAAALQHPHIVPVLGTGEIQGMPYFTMPFVEGESLGDRLHRTGPLPPRQAVSVLRDVAKALAYAHERQIVHRDIKPDNVMLSGGSAVVTDFGIAKAISLAQHAPGGITLTQAGTVLGTPAYMAPEQAAGDPSVDHRADLYAFGCLAYETLTGRTPFVEPSVHQLFVAHLSATPVPIDVLRPEVPPLLATLVMQCLEKDATRRPATAQAILASLEMITSGGNPSLRMAAATPLPPPFAGPVTGPVPWLLATRWGLLALLLLTGAVNLLQTTMDQPVAQLLGVAGLREEVARAMLGLEWFVRFDGHDVTNSLAAYGATFVYFFLFPALLVAVGMALWRRPQITAFRTAALAVAVDYLISLPAFLLFPVPERWSVPASGAVLLSNRWSSGLIEAIRPMSGLDNCFPSFHVSLAVIAVTSGFLFGVRLRWAALWCGLAVVFATFMLGVHWLADIVAGLAVGLISVALAAALERRIAAGPASRTLAPVSGARLAGLLLLLAGAPAEAQTSLTFAAVALDGDTRRADDRLRRHLEGAAGVAFVAEDASEYSHVIDFLATRRPDDGSYVARMTPYALVAAELLGANLQVLGTYVSRATGSTTYQSYFVVSRDRFATPPGLDDLVAMLRAATRPPVFAYHSEFSSSSYFLPSLFLRRNDFFDMAASTGEATAIRARRVGGGSGDLVKGVATGAYDLAAVWSGTRAAFEATDSLARYARQVWFLPLPEELPNDLIVAAASLDSATAGRLRAALAAMTPEAIGVGDFVTWRQINDAPEARAALAALRWMARAAPAPVTVDVQRVDSPRGRVSDAELLAVRQAVRLAGGEFVNFDRDFHSQQDYVVTLEPSHDGTIVLRSRIVGADQFDQSFQLSFKEPAELTTRVAELLRARMHRVRYLWPYRTSPPTILRDVDFELAAGTPVVARMIRWLDPHRHSYTQDALFPAEIARADHSKVELTPAFVSSPDADGFVFNPLSNISYRVILPRRVDEPLLFRVLTVVLTIVLLLAALAAVRELRRNPAVVSSTGEA